MVGQAVRRSPWASHAPLTSVGPATSSASELKSRKSWCRSPTGRRISERADRVSGTTDAAAVVVGSLDDQSAATSGRGHVRSGAGYSRQCAECSSPAIAFPAQRALCMELRPLLRRVRLESVSAKTRADSLSLHGIAAPPSSGPTRRLLNNRLVGGGGGRPESLWSAAPEGGSCRDCGCSGRSTRPDVPWRVRRVAFGGFRPSGCLTQAVATTQVPLIRASPRTRSRRRLSPATRWCNQWSFFRTPR